MLKTVLNTSSAAILIAAIGSTAAFAQTSDAGLDEIVITAQRTEQSLQDVSVAVEAFDQESLTRDGLESAKDLGSLSPALGISAGGGPLTSIFVRGVGALSVNPLSDAAVAQNVDGVYLGRSSGAAGLALYDLERVELLKGPQGTLYGRNATGGVINFIPQKPVMGESGGYVQAEYGRFNKIGLQGAMNLAVEDKAAFRLSGNLLKRDGYSDDGTNDADSFSLRGQALFELGASTTVRFAGDYSEDKSKGPGGDFVGTFSNDTGSLDVFTASGIAIDSGPSSPEANALRNTILHTPSFAPFPDIQTENLFQDLSFKGLSAEIIHQTDIGTFTIVPAYRESDQNYAFAGPGFGPANTSEQNNQKSIEARFDTDFEGPLNGIIGAFYIDEEISTSTNFNQAYTSPIQNYDNGGESWALFADGTFDVSETVRLYAGLRYTEDTKFVDGVSDTFVTFCGGAPARGDFLTPGPPFIANAFNHGCAVPGLIPNHPITSNRNEFIQHFVDLGLIAADSVATVPGNGPPTVYNFLIPGLSNFGNSPDQIAAIVNVGDGVISNDLSFNELTYRGGIEWDWGDNNLLYAGYDRGYRAGGVDLSTGATAEFDSEFIDAFKVGSKNRFLDNTLQVNGEAFLWKYDGQQISYFTTIDSAASFPVANADATIMGAEIDVIWAVADNTTISGSAQILDSTYDELVLISDEGRGRFGCESLGLIPDADREAGVIENFDCSGQDALFSPKFGADASINHIVNLSDFDLSLTADASYRGQQSTSFSFLPETDRDAYFTLNLDATLSPEDAGWALSVFMRNVTDERFLQNSNVQNRGSFYGVYNAPQTYGARIRANF
ncbi:MAG: TonB-dependent receptor [Litorimonas sp.]